MKNEIIKRAKKVELLILDVDGVLTNGEIIVDDDGKETKIFNVQDGFGIVLFKRVGFKVAIISARKCAAVTARAKDLGIDKVFQNAHPKLKAYDSVLKHFKLKDENICFMGDDLPDLGVLKRVGFAVTVPNGVKETKKEAHYVTKKEGGKGAVREIIELLLNAKGLWKGVVKTYA